jgi:hypothetical protein
MDWDSSGVGLLPLLPLSQEEIQTLIAIKVPGKASNVGFALA